MTKVLFLRVSNELYEAVVASAEKDERTINKQATRLLRKALGIRK